MIHVVESNLINTDTEWVIESVCIKPVEFRDKLGRGGGLSPGTKQTVRNDDVSILIKQGSVKQGLTLAVLQLSQ